MMTQHSTCQRSLPTLALAVLTLSVGSSLQAQIGFLGSPVQPTAQPATTFTVLNSPSLPGDLIYKGIPQNRLRTSTGVVHVSSLQGLFIGDVDWPGGAPDFYDIALCGSSTADRLPGDALVPEIFTGGGVDMLLSLGNSGLPHPCTVMPTSTCTLSTQCPQTLGYIVDVALPSPIAMAVGSGDQAGLALIEFVPGGMTFSTSGHVGSCGQGDYVVQGAVSDVEQQAGYLRTPNVSVGQGFQMGLPGGGISGPIADTPNVMSRIQLGILEPVIEPALSDSTVGYSNVRGGASLGLDTSTGTTSIAAVISADPIYAGKLCFPMLSPGQLANPVPIFGAPLLLTPGGILTSTFSAWSGTGPLTLENAGGFTEYASVTSPSIALPVISSRPIYLQAFIITGFVPITAVSTTVWALNLE